jgi:hypothetical protein
VDRWVDRYAVEGVAGLLDRSHAAPRDQVPVWVTGRILALTRQTPPESTGLSHWSSRQMAAHLKRTEGVTVSWHYVASVWRRHGLKPHRQGTFKVSRDPAFAAKVADVVGLYLDPPGGAVVLSIDEKTQIQALDRTQPLLPVDFGRTEKRTHDYVRHGTTNLFAALNVGTGKVTADCYPTAQARTSCGSCARPYDLIAASRSMSSWTTCPRTTPPRSGPGWSATRTSRSTSPRSDPRG